MIKETGNMWDIWSGTDHFICPCSSVLKNHPEALPMGRGMARQIKNSVPGINIMLGRKIKRSLPIYGVVTVGKVGAMQVKERWNDDINFGLLQISVGMLYDLADEAPSKRFDLSFPTSSDGLLPEQKPLVERAFLLLPNNVHVWSLAR